MTDYKFCETCRAIRGRVGMARIITAPLRGEPDPRKVMVIYRDTFDCGHNQEFVVVEIRPGVF